MLIPSFLKTIEALYFVTLSRRLILRASLFIFIVKLKVKKDFYFKELDFSAQILNAS